MRALARRFVEFVANYSCFFDVARRNVSKQARCYVAGLVMKAPRKNMERMEEYVAESDYQSQQNFLTDSPWDSRPVLDQIAKDVSQLLGGRGSVLIVDESGFSKKGGKSAGVDRQWNGRLGKIDNCQVGVFAALGDRNGASLIDAQLYLPESWTKDSKRCREAKIPDEFRVHRSKPEIALEMILRAKANGVAFGSVALDAGYGAATWLLRELDERQIRFTADVRSNQVVYVEDPRRLTGSKRARAARTVEEFFTGSESGPWRRLSVREGTKGKVRVSACARRVWIAPDKASQAREWWVVCVVDAASGDTKFFLSNFAAEMNVPQMVRTHAMRYWVERAFQDAKTSLGMADYQARGWGAWHHHMAMVSLAMLFCLRERRLHLRRVELLSFQDLVELLTVFLPRKDAGPEAVLEMIAKRHRKRRQAIEAARRKERRQNAGVAA